MNLCIETSSCVAIDVSASICVVHTSVNATVPTFTAPRYTHYILNRACLSSLQSTYFGNCCYVCLCNIYRVS